MSKVQLDKLITITILRTTGTVITFSTTQRDGLVERILENAGSNPDQIEEAPTDLKM